MDKIICVGKNYLKHALELGDPVPSEPTYFLKPPSCLHVVDKNNQIVRLPRTGEVHHEIELVFKIQNDSKGRPSFSHYTLGLDLTLRALQSSLKKAGQPWEKAKVFAHSAILGPWKELRSMDDVLDMNFQLLVNGQIRQKGMGLDMRWKPDFLLEDVARWFPVCDNDLLFTGTPEGVGPLLNGDSVTVQGGNLEYSFTCEVLDHA